MMSGPYPQQGQPGYPSAGQQPPPGYSPAGQQPPHGYPQGPPVQTTTVVMAQPPVIVQQFREIPVRMQCPACRADVMTGVRYEIGLMTWLLCGIMFLFGFWICCFIPFCIDQCKDVTHTCPNCQHVVGVYKRLS